MTIPIEFRRELGIEEGDSVAIERNGNTLVVRRTGSVVERTKGALSKYRKDPPLSIEEEKEAFAQAIVDDYLESEARSR
jgi:bifunctional DNA-binding transcriptional regulator/antitoxin component of YhaV-PrlF toxin-antitoxin module